jgi:aromatic-L-amino-acid decarboxylase
VEGADSLVVNPHKWLFTPFDCSVLYLKRPDILKRAFSLVPEYLVTREQDAVVNYMDYGVQLGRRFRALKLWMIIRAFGVDGLAERLRQHCALARTFAAWVEEDPHWQLLAPVPFSLVCFRYAPPNTDEATRDRMNEAIMHAVNAGGDVFLSHTKMRGKFTLRLAIGNIRTEERHVALAWQRLREAAASCK